MNYCSLAEAWGVKSKISNNYKDYMNNIETFKNNDANLLSEEDNNIHNPNLLISSFTSNDKFQTNNDANNSKSLNEIYNLSNKNISNHTQIKSNIDFKNDNLISCDNVILHIKNCISCQQKLQNYIRPNIVDSLYTIIEKNKDIIVLILIGISILLFFNLIINLTKN